MATLPRESAEASETLGSYYRARYYDPETGRFLREDPIGFEGGLDFYEYAANSPVIWRDPIGLMPWGPPAIMVYSRVPGLVSRRKLRGDLRPLCRKGRNLTVDAENLGESIATRIAEIEYYLNHPDISVSDLADDDPEGGHPERIEQELETLSRCRDNDPKCDKKPQPFAFPVPPEWSPDAKRVPVGAPSASTGGVVTTIVTIILGIGLILAF